MRQARLLAWQRRYKLDTFIAVIVVFSYGDGEFDGGSSVRTLRCCLPFSVVVALLKDGVDPLARAIQF